MVEDIVREGKTILKVTEPTSEVFRIVRNDEGFDVEIADGVTLTEAANKFISAVESILEAKRILSPFRWVSVGQALPEFDRTVIVASEGGIVDLAHRVDLEGGLAWYHLSRTHYPITHWMPCPQHPRV